MWLVPIGIDNFSTGWREAVKFGPFVEADLIEKQALLALFKRFMPLAAF